MFKRFFAVAVVALAALSLLGLESAHAAEAVDTGAAADDFVARINDLRASQGLSQLVVDPALVSIAADWTQHMAATNTLSHRPNLADVAPGDWTKLGENVGYGGAVATLHAAFVGSPGHYANLVNPGYQYIGVSVVMSGSTMWVTENFMAASRPGVTAASASSGGGNAASLASAPAVAPVAAKAPAPCKTKKCKAAKKVVAKKAVKVVAVRHR
ncbi:MAG: hypothetical protein QOF60_83 [Actinomycetota bacterium]|nr:hypothetical protein [Actinomycetota bacterium]